MPVVSRCDVCRLGNLQVVAGVWDEVLAAERGSWQGAAAGLHPQPQQQQTATRRLTAPAAVGADDASSAYAEAARNALQSLAAAAADRPAVQRAPGCGGAATDASLVQELGVVRFERLC